MVSNTTKTTKQKANSSKTSNQSVGGKQSVSSGTQFVTNRGSGAVNYAEIPFDQYAGAMGNASSKSFANTIELNRMIAEWAKNDPRTQASAYSTRRTADAAYKQAEAAYMQARNGGNESSTWDKIRDENRRISEMRENRAQWYREQFATENEQQYQSGQNNANRELDRYLAGLKKDTELDVAKINSSTQRSVASIQQPLNADQLLEKTRIENPDPIKGMATNLLGSYASQGGRSNFAYWG